MSPVYIISFFLFTLILGSIPFAVWLGKLTGNDPRRVGDHNPGAVNALKSGGWKLGLAVLMLDITKAALPVGLAYQVFGWRGVWMGLIALAPMFGHAFSPFLAGRGGKGAAAALGVWIGLTLWTVPAVALAALSLAFVILTASGWAITVALLTVAAYLVLFVPDPLLLSVLAGQAIILIWKYRHDLRGWPRIRRRGAKIGI